MKKRILSALLSAVIGVMSVGAVNAAEETGELILSNTTKVNVENTDTCFAKVTDAEYHADMNYYMHFKSEGDWLEVTKNLTESVTAGSTYVLTVVAKPVSGTTWFRIGWDDTGWLTSAQEGLATDLGDGWFKYVKEVTMTADQSNVLFHNDGAAEIYVESISLKPVGEDKELIESCDFDTNAYSVNVENTDACFAKVLSEEVYSDNEYSLHFKTPASQWLEVTQNLNETAVAGGKYVLSAWVKPVSGRVWFRVGWDADGWMVADSDLGTEWIKVEKEVTLVEDQTNVLFHNADDRGDVEFYIDDISLKAVGSDVELMPDGGFDEVTVDGVISEIGTPDEKLILSNTTTVNNTETAFAKVTDNTKNSGDYSIHYKSGTDHFEVSQKLLENTAKGETYLFSAYVKMVKGQVWFRIGWDNAAWMAVSKTEGEDEWVKVEKEVTIEGNDNNGDLNTVLFHNAGETECYIDDISLVKVGETTELMPDGGFEEVTIEGEEPEIPHEHNWNEGVVTLEPTTEAEGIMTYTCECGKTYTEAIERLPAVDIPDEDLILSDTTKVSVENTDTCYAKVTDNEKNSGNYGLHLKATAADWIEVTQSLTENAVTGEKYVISAYVKPVQGRVWFRLGWDNDAWLAADATLGTEWVKVEKEVTVAGNEGDLTTLIIHNDGATEFYIDDISVVKAGTETELVPDGGFDEVTVVGGEEPPVVEPEDPTETIPDENLTLSNTTHQNVENTATCYTKVTDDTKSEGNYSLFFKATADDWLEVDQTLTEGVTAGSTYILSASVKVVSGKVWFRVGWDDAGWLVSNQTDLGTDLGNGWVKLVKEVTLTGDQTKILFHNEGATEMYIDDISLKAVGSDTELVPDGGFEEVTIFEDIPDEDLILSDKTQANQENTDTCFAKATDNEKNSGNYSLHLKAGAEDWMEVTQNLTESATAGGQYVFTAYIKPTTGKVWFRLNWDDTAWMVSTQEGTVQDNGWTKIEKTVTLTADQSKLLFHNEGEADMYIDDISLVAVGGTENLIPDGGFEDVIVYEEVVVPEGPENEYVLTSTRINVENYEPTTARYAEATDEVKHNGDYSLHLKTGSDYLEIAQDYTEALAAGTYTLTWYAVGEGRIWFYSNWGTDLNPEEYTASHVVDSAELQADGWTKYTKVINIDGVGDTSFLFCADGTVDMCIDDVSLVDASGVDYIADGGFEDVKITACTGEHVWDEGVVTLEPTTEAEGVKTFTCTVCIATKTEAIEKLPSEPTYVAGDANGDGGVDTKDVIMIRRSIAGGYGVEIDEQAADVTGDGKADTKDVIMIRRFITGGYGVEL